MSAVDSSDVVLSAVTVNVLLSVGVDMSAKAAYSAVDSSGAQVLGEAMFSAVDSGSIQMFAAFPSVLAGSIQAVNSVFSVGNSSDVSVSAVTVNSLLSAVDSSAVDLAAVTVNSN